MDSVSSTTFIKKPPYTTDIQEQFSYTKLLLSGRIFLGFYQERRHVPLLQDYRDVIIISPEETELKNDIDKVNKNWSGVKSIKWVGITGPDSDIMPKVYCFWCKLSNLAFGCYWFQIKHVKLQDGEVVLNLKCIRKSHAPLIAITSQFNENPISKDKFEKGETQTPKVFLPEINAKTALSAIKATCSRKLYSAQSVLTWRTIFHALKVAIALIITLVMGIISLIGHLGDYTLKLIREFTLLVNAFTPIIIQLIDFLTKVIGGLYILIAGMFMRNPIPPNSNSYRNQNLYSVTYPNASKPPQTLAVDWRKRNQLLRQELLSNSLKKNNF